MKLSSFQFGMLAGAAVFGVCYAAAWWLGLL